MRPDRVCVIACLAMPVLLLGCGPEQRGGPRLETSPLVGQVLVDGDPVQGVRVMCHPGPDAPIAYEVVGMTDAEGRFSISTYQAGDGLPPGTYALTFELLEGAGLGRSKDVFGGRYSDPKKSEYTVTVEERTDDDAPPEALLIALEK